MGRVSKKVPAAEAENIAAGSDSTTELVVKKGSEREYVVSEHSSKVLDLRLHTSSKEKLLVAALVAVTLYIRTTGLQSPSEVVFDEVHFGKFAAKYIRHEFFMDVHPPLAKMLYGLVGFLGGFNGNFNFEKIGDDYPSSVPYVFMRQFSAFCGVSTVLLMYYTLKLTGCKPVVCFITSLLLVFESATATIDRFILLDSPMIMFISAAIYSYIKLDITKPFSFLWYKSLVASGICLGLAASSKWVGLFTIGWAAVCTVIRLWFAIGDLDVPARQIWKQALLRLFATVLAVLTIYIGSFYVHFSVLNANEGDATSFVSSAFRASFDHNSLPGPTLADVGISSIVTIKHLNSPEAYLHSHGHNYEGGSKQQQVTLYPYQDDNNRWSVELYNLTTEPKQFVPILDGTKIRLRHIMTARRLHSHDIRPAVSNVDWQNEASCYGYEGFEGDPNDDFVVEIDKDLSKPGVAQQRVRAIDTVFRLHHAMTGCYLFSHMAQLPKWGFEQNEVTCARSGIKPLSLWYIEDNQNLYLDQDAADKVEYKPLNFWQRLLELNKAMWNLNEGLTQHHVYESSPYSWPLLLRGISYWKGQSGQLYLLGNPVVWWIASFIFVPFAVFVVFKIFRWQYGSRLTYDASVFNYLNYMAQFGFGWLLHYAPFFLMGRQLFLHHYLPALYFGILALGQTLELFNSYIFRSRKFLSYALLVALLAAAVFGFLQRKAIVYGGSWSEVKCSASKWLPGWDYDCNVYPVEEPPSPVVGSLSSQPVPTSSAINFDEAVSVPLKDEL